LGVKYLIFAALGAVAVLGSVDAQAAKEPLRLKQTSQWNVDYADERCRLMRQFGEGEERVFAIFDQFGPGEYFRMTIAGKPMRTGVTEGDVTIQFGPSESEQRLAFYKGTLGDDPALVFHNQTRLAGPTSAEQAAIAKAKKGEWIKLAPVPPERQSAIRTLTIGKPLARTVILETGPMRKPLEAMATCIDSLMTSWGVDVERHKTLTRYLEPLSSPEKWVVSGDYPTKMVSEGQPALVQFRLSVGADGVPLSCHIQLTTRPKEFDAAVCHALMRRARFNPALDADGQPLTSYYLNTVRFALP
jgi:hypothetical protein